MDRGTRAYRIEVEHAELVDSARSEFVDRLPGYPQISVFVGAGHGYKFAALFGKILSELAIDGQTHYPIQAFAVDRPAITDPDFPPSLHT